jgi:hypothetical protein
MSDRELAEVINDDVWETLPRRLLQVLIVALLLAIAVATNGCGVIKPDPDYMYGPKSTFEKHERYSGGN